MIRLMLPICFAKPATKAFSVSVLVSAGEFANIASIFFAIAGDCVGFVDFDHVPADLVADMPTFAQHLVQVVVVEEQLRLVGRPSPASRKCRRC